MNKFINAFNGLKISLNHKGLLIQYTIALVVGIITIFIDIALWKKVSIVLCIFLVLVSETINTCIERICDKICEHYDDDIKDIKDMAAGFVLLSSICALTIAFMVLIGE